MIESTPPPRSSRPSSSTFCWPSAPSLSSSPTPATWAPSQTLPCAWDWTSRTLPKARYAFLHWAGFFRCTVLVLRMAHRKWEDIKQQPSILPGPAVPGGCLVSFHILWAILSTSTVQRSPIRRVLGCVISPPGPLWMRERVHAT